MAACRDAHAAGTVMPATAPLRPWARTRPTQPGNERARIDLKHCGQGCNIQQPDIAFTSLHRTDVSPMQTHPVRELLLRQPRLLAGTTDPATKLTQDLVVTHACHFRLKMTIGLQTISIIGGQSQSLRRGAHG